MRRRDRGNAARRFSARRKRRWSSPSAPYAAAARRLPLRAPADDTASDALLASSLLRAPRDQPIAGGGGIEAEGGVQGLSDRRLPHRHRRGPDRGGQASPAPGHRPHQQVRLRRAAGAGDPAPRRGLPEAARDAGGAPVAAARAVARLKAAAGEPKRARSAEHVFRRAPEKSGIAMRRRGGKVTLGFSEILSDAAPPCARPSTSSWPPDGDEGLANRQERSIIHAKQHVAPGLAR